MTTWQKYITSNNAVIQCLLLGTGDLTTSEIARLTRDKDGDWTVTSKLLNVNQEYLASKNVSEEDAKSLIETQVYRYCTDQKQKYNELCNSLCFS